MDEILSGIKKLKSSGDFDKIDLSRLDCFMDELKIVKKEELLSKHPYKIWQGKNGMWYTYIPDEKGGRKLRYRNSKIEIENLVIRYFRNKIESPTVREVFDEWIKKRLDREEIEKSTYSRYQRNFEENFSKIKDRKIRTISEIEIEDFLKDVIRDRRLSRKAYSNLRTLLYGIFRYAKKKGLVSYSIKQTVADIEFSKKEFTVNRYEDNERVFMLDEEERMTEYLMQNQDIMNLGLLLLFKTGLRIGELSVLTPADISGCNIHICKTETIYKGDDGKMHYEAKNSAKTFAGMRTVIIPKNYKWILDKIRYLNPFGEYLFMKNGKRIRSYQFRNRLRTNCKRTGVVVKTPHAVRRTYGTKLYDSDIERSFIIQQMGHTDITCLEKNYYVNRKNDSEKEEMINRIKAI